MFGFSNVYLEGERAIIRNEETNLGDVTADANAAALRDAIGDVPFVISLKNGGGIRSSIGTVSDPDPVTGAISKLPTEANPDATTSRRVRSRSSTSRTRCASTTS